MQFLPSFRRRRNVINKLSLEPCKGYMLVENKMK